MNWIRTYSGKDVSLSDPQPVSIEIRDIACSLSRINRFNGATRLPLNVADHSLNVVRWLAMSKASPFVQLLGLLHDAHEAYIGDITEPMRREISEWAGRSIVEQIAGRLDKAIRLAFDLGETVDSRMLDRVQLADRAVAAAEWRDLMDGPSPIAAQPAPFAIKPKNSDQAEAAFLKTFQLLHTEVGPAPTNPFRS